MNARRLQTLAVLTAVVLLGPMANSQHPAFLAQTTLAQTTTFAAPDGAFRFSYPSDFRVCAAGKIDACAAQSFIPVCDADALVCVLYPSKRFEGTNFGAAAFQVREIRREGEMTTPNVCVTPYPSGNGPEFLVSAEHPVELIGGLKFLHGIAGDVATSHSRGIDLYRAFHSQRCFEVSVTTTATEPTVSDPPMKTLTSAQGKTLDQSMSQILHSFRFSIEPRGLLFSVVEKSPLRSFMAD
jgi:hypothetical protein